MRTWVPLNTWLYSSYINPATFDLTRGAKHQPARKIFLTHYLHT